jgi:tetratricopeptide (TPR) repeat protein
MAGTAGNRPGRIVSWAIEVAATVGPDSMQGDGNTGLPMSTDAADVADMFKRAMAAYETGQFADAESLCVAMLGAEPEDFDVHRLLAVAQFRRGGRIEALASYDRLLALRPDFAEGHNNRAVVLADLKRFDEALASYDKALTLRPEYAEARHNRGTALLDLGRMEDAIADFDRAVAIRPDYAAAFHSRGTALIALGRRSEALASFDRALAFRPDGADTLIRRADLLGEFNRFEEALASYDKALTLRPDVAETHDSRGKALAALRRFPEAIASFERAQALAPDMVRAHVNEAVARLISGDLARGFAKYEWHRKMDAAPRRAFSKPRWDGLNSLYDKTILLYDENRFSDAIQFCRYVPQVAGRGARVILQVAPPLRRLMGNLVGVSQVHSDEDALPDFDLHCPLASLPLAFGTKLDTIPSGTPYLRPPTGMLLAWEMRLSARKRPRIGLAWAGDPRHEGDRDRSIGLRTLMPLLDVDATFVRLQTELRAGDEAVLKNRDDIFDPTEMLNDFSDTAALVARLDLVISVDTSAAHLAGALGKPVWILLSCTPDWRWLLGRGTTPWYPTAHLYRQAAPGDWGEVAARVKADIPSLMGRTSPAPPVRNLS